MGKSDPAVFNFYGHTLENRNHYNKIGFFGFSGEDIFTTWFVSKDRKFFDLSLDNWNINDFPYCSEEKFDLIV